MLSFFLLSIDMLATFIAKAGKRSDRMKAYLMGRMPECGIAPENLSADISCKIIVDKIPDGIVCHRSLNYVIIVYMPASAFPDKIKPFIGHCFKSHTNL